MPSLWVYSVKYRQYAMTAVLMTLVVVFSAVAALAQTPVPPPTLTEITDAVMTVVSGIAIVMVIVAAGFVLGASIRFIVRLIRSGR